MLITLKKLTAAILILSVLSAFLSGCSKQAEDITDKRSPVQKEPVDTEEISGKEAPSETVTEETAMNNKSVAKAINTFNWDYFDTLDTEKNTFYSPFSLVSALAMTYAGAGGSTKEELSKALHIDDIDAFLSAYSLTSSGFSKDAAKLTVANSLWIDKSFNEKGGINPSFSEKLKEKMDAEVLFEDFANAPEAAAGDISKWVSEKTEGLIGDYKASMDSSTVMAIINAIYFYGEWQKKFSAAETYERNFNTGKDTGFVNMMNMYDTPFRYYSDDDFKGIELPYADGSVAMDIILSSDDEAADTADKFKALTSEQREAFISNISAADEKEISELALPKFTMDISAEGLKDSLKQMGINSAFDPSAANFENISDDLFISDISHRAKIEVDEEGSRAAAVTEIEMSVTALPPEDIERITFICDRPFVYVIRDTESSAILFTGVVNKP